MTYSTPLCLTPWLRAMPWGGSRLEQLYAAVSQGKQIGEAWLLSDHRLHHSIVSQGEHAGQSLHQLLRHDAVALLGREVGRVFPVMVKALEAAIPLSVQVHPDDELARKWSPAEGGKSEAWHILEAAEDARLYIGLLPGIDPVKLKHLMTHGEPEEYLRTYRPVAGQTYQLPAGTVHALGPKVLTLEIQQTSDATFRLYDWKRIDESGKGRELHQEAGLACIQEAGQSVLVSPIQEDDGAWRLVSNRFFTLRKWEQVSRAAIQGPSIVVPWNGAARCNGVEITAGTAALVPYCLRDAVMELEAGTVLYQVVVH